MGTGHNLRKHKNMPKCPQSRVAVIVAPAIHPYNAQLMEGSVQSAARSTTFREACWSGRNRTIHDLEQEPDQHHEENAEPLNKRPNKWL